MSSIVKDVSSELSVGMENQTPKDTDVVLSEAAQRLSITGDENQIPKENDTGESQRRIIGGEKTRRAAKLLNSGDLLNALLEIESALELYPENDVALTIRGKIYLALALAGGKPSSKVKKAFLDFEAALQLNMTNMEAAQFRDAILMESRLRNQIPKENDTGESLRRIIGEKTRRAAKLLNSGFLLNALLLIESALELNPENDVALTIRGKIYLALAGGKPSSKVKKAFFDFEAALQLNMTNMEAAEFRDSILMESRRSFIDKNMTEKAKKIEDLLGNRVLSEKTKVFLKNIKKRKSLPKKSSSIGTGASTFQSVPFLVPNEEPMDI